MQLTMVCNAVEHFSICDQAAAQVLHAAEQPGGSKEWRGLVGAAAAAASSHRKNALHLSRPDLPCLPAVAALGDRCLMPFELQSLLLPQASLCCSLRELDGGRAQEAEESSISQVPGDGQPTNKTSGNFGSANGRARFTC